MSRSPTISRRTVLLLMGSALATACLSVAVPVKAMAKPFGCLPGSLSLLPLQNDLLRKATRRLRAHPENRSAYRAAQTYLCSSGNPRARDRFEQQVRREFVMGRLTIVDGWMISETEMALLALLEHSQGAAISHRKKNREP